MKKTIVIILLVVYIASIAVVNFFGLEIKIFDGIIYVEQIKCNTITVRNENAVTLEPKQMLAGKPLFIFDFIPADEDNPYTTVTPLHKCTHVGNNLALLPKETVQGIVVYAVKVAADYLLLH